MERLCVIAGLVLLSGMEVLMKGVGSGLFCVEKRVSKSEGDRKKTKNGRTKTHNDIQPREILKLNHRIPSWTTQNKRRQHRPHHTLRNRRLKIDRNGEEAFVLAEYHFFAGGGC